MHELFEFLLRSPIAAPLTDLDAWWQQHSALRDRFATPLALAVAGGFVSHCLGYAFASGYNAALGRLWAPAQGRKVALCASEEGGAHPRAIATRAQPSGTGWQLDGHKTWVTLGTHAELLLVAARRGSSEDGRPRLVLLAVDRELPGVQLRPGAALPFVPEVPHATLSLTDVRVPAEALLPGDGYSAYLKPFRSIEDIHVHAALTGWLIRLGRRWDWPASQLEELLQLAAGLHALAASDPLHPGTHLALAGSLTQLQALLERLPWQRCDPETLTLWQRDRALLSVASKARAARQRAAQKALFGG